MRVKVFIQKHFDSPVRRNIIANLFGVGVTLLNQVVLVPFYIFYWGNYLYSDWIVLSALTAFFTMSDVGLNSVIQNRFSIKLAQQDTRECNSLLTDNLIIITVIMVLVLIGAYIYISCFDICSQLGINAVSRHEAHFIFMVLLVNVFLRMYSMVVNAIYRATRNASRSVYFDQCGMLSVGIITLLAIVCHVSMVWLSVLICIPNVLLMIVKSLDVRKYYAYRFRLSQADFGLIKQLALPSLSFMSFPLGNAIVLQGYTLLVNKFFGADSVVIYNTTRTMCNFVKVLLATIQNSIWPEYSISFGKSDFKRMRHLHRKAIKIAIMASIAISVVLLIFGPYIFEYWTGIPDMFLYDLMVAYLIVLITENLWTSSSVTLMATNNHSWLGLLFVMCSLAAIGSAYFVAVNDGKLYQIALTMMIIHIVLATYAIRKGLQLTHDKMLLLFRKRKIDS